MGSGIEIPIPEAMVFNLSCASADGFLKQHPSGVFFVGEQLVNCFSIPPGLAGRGENLLLLQTSGNFSKAVAVQISLENPADNFGLHWINSQLAIRSRGVSIAFAPGHFRGTILETFPQTGFNRKTLFNVSIRDSP